MKKVRVIIYVLAFLIASVLGILFLYNLINSKLDQSTNTAAPSNNETSSSANTQSAESDDQGLATTQLSDPASGSKVPTSAETTKTEQLSTTAATTPIESTTVSTVNLSEDKPSLYTVIGTVKAKTAGSIFPQTSATISKINYAEGDFVKKGQIIAEMTGANLTEHPTLKQLKIAQTTYDNALVALNNLVKTNGESLKTAQLQLQTAVSQASAVPYDLQVIEQNQSGANDNLRILQDSLNQTRDKNARDQAKSRYDIDDLINTINQAQDARGLTQRQINDLQDQLNLSSGQYNPTTSDPASSTSINPLNEKLIKLLEALKAQDKGIEDLYDALDKARYGYSTSLNAAQLTENQVLAQILQSQNQDKVLELNLQSSKTKLGYTGDTTDALELAKQAYNSTKLQLQTSQEAAQNQLKIAKLNLELAQDQSASLQIKAPFDGILTALNLTEGQSVTPQTAAAEMIDPKLYQLEIGVDFATADRLAPGQKALVELAPGRTMEVPINSVSPKVDEKTKLVKVVLGLPNIAFKLNQNLKAQLPLSPTQIAYSEGQASSHFLIPLDAVTIGTESQFVYVYNNGKAKKTTITTGSISGDQIEVLSGLQPSDQIILEGAKSLTDGQAIQLKS